MAFVFKIPTTIALVQAELAVREANRLKQEEKSNKLDQMFFGIGGKTVLVMPNSREHMPTSSGAPPLPAGDAPGCNSDREQTERRAAEAEPLGTLVRLRVRPIVPGSSPVIRRMSPHRHLPMTM